MRNLARYLAIPFDDPGISLSELTAFTTDFIERATNNNPGGALDSRIAAVTSALGIVETCFTEDIMALGTRKARKTAKRLFREGLAAHTLRIEGILTGLFGANATQVQQAFPSGRNILNKCPDDDLNNHLTAVNTVVSANAASLPPAIVTLSAGLVTTWTTIYQESEGASGAKTATEAEKRAAREALQLELFLSLAKLMELFPRQLDKMALYMTQSLLEDTSNGDDGEEEPQPAPEPEV